MSYTTHKIAGRDAIQLLNEHRSHYPATGLYPFLMGDSNEVERLQEAAEYVEQDSETIIRTSFDIRVAQWLEKRQKEDESLLEEILGEWPGNISQKGSISLHMDLLTEKIKPEIYFGLAKIAEPWQLPAILKYGGWNDCPDPDVHCAFHRHWQEMYGAEIIGVSGDVIECLVRNPPTERNEAIDLAWEQYRYCGDIVEQGCGSVSNLAGTLLDSKYWYFWWD